MLRAMLLIRAFETALQQRADEGFQLYSAGQEAVAVGLCAALTDDDQLLCSGRAIGPALARGVDPGAVMAELLGRTAGPCGGKGGRGHIAQPASGFFGAHAVVSGNLAIAAGVALARQQQNHPGIVACLFGDGACGAGALHETLNIAAIWRLPLLFVCDNNRFSVSTPRSAALAPAQLADLARPFGIPARTVDGMDVNAVHAACRDFAAHARAGNGPAFLECLSHRFQSHSTGTRETRSAAELAEIHALCPIERHAAALRLDPTARAALEADIARDIAAAIRFAEASPPPLAADVLHDV